MPPITGPSSTLVFETEVLPSDKIRVTVEVAEKIVTFDWPLPPTPPAAAADVGVIPGFGPGASKADSGKKTLFFAARLSKKCCSISVE